MAWLTPIISPTAEVHALSPYSDPSTPPSTTVSSYSPTSTPTRTADTSPAVDSPTPYSETFGKDNQSRDEMLMASVAISPSAFKSHSDSATTVKNNCKEPHEDAAIVVDNDDTSQYEGDDDSVDFKLGHNSNEPTTPPPPEYVQRQLEAERELESEDESGNIVDLIEGTSNATAKVIMEKITVASDPSTLSGNVMIGPSDTKTKLDSRLLPIQSRSVGLLPGASHSYVQSPNGDPRRVAGGRIAHKSSRWWFLAGSKKPIVPYDVAASSFQTSRARARLHSRAIASDIRFGRRKAHGRQQCWSQMSRTQTLPAAPAPVPDPRATAFGGPDWPCDTDVEMTDCDTCDTCQVIEDVEMMDADRLETDYFTMPQVLLENAKRAPSLADDADVAIYFCRTTSSSSGDEDEDDSDHDDNCDNDHDDDNNDDDDDDDDDNDNSTINKHDDDEDAEDSEDYGGSFCMGMW
ncbi:hypothetical protein V1525DRAFT_418491 [Lipomyces kononenkoae]|uniref:Uncharacterized protein n=1 Tax=Lipomyces kononenkoae TaxID=34357 RepID=A0ACC3T4K3_LIPKO